MDSTWDEMKQANPAERKVSVGVTATLIAEISDFRVAMIVSTGGALALYLGLTPDVSSGKGVCLDTGNLSLSLSLPLHGRLLRGPVWAISPGGAQTVTVWEVLHPCPCLR